MPYSYINLNKLFPPKIRFCNKQIAAFYLRIAHKSYSRK